MQPPRAGTLLGMSSVISSSVASALFGVEAVTLAQHIADVLGESLVAADGVAADLDAVRDGVGWVDVHTVALSHDMAGPGA